MPDISRTDCPPVRRDLQRIRAQTRAGKLWQPRALPNAKRRRAVELADPVEGASEGVSGGVPTLKVKFTVLLVFILCLALVNATAISKEGRVGTKNGACYCTDIRQG